MVKYIIGGKDEGRIKGFLMHEEKEYPFAYEDGILELYPPDKNVWLTDNAQLLCSIGEKIKSGEFINNICLYGRTATNKTIRFIVSEQYSNINGFLSFNVRAVYIYQSDSVKRKQTTVPGEKKYYAEYSQNKIRGMIITGREINYYYNPSSLFDKKFPQEDPDHIFNLSVKESEELDCGSITFQGKEINIFVRGVATIHNVEPIPITSRSEMIIKFSDEIDLEMVEKMYYAILTCLSYLCRRKNIDIGLVEVFDYDENGHRTVFGTYQIVSSINTMEKQVQANERIISHCYINNNFATLLNEFLTNKIYIDNLPNNLDSCRKYSPDRMIFDFVAFEREYDNIYSDSVSQSNEYVEVKNLIMEKMIEIINDLRGRRKKYAKGLYKIIKNSENSLGERLKRAFKDYEEALVPFFVDNYGKNYKEELNKICERMNKMRNDLAHGNLDIEFTPKHIRDLSMIECLLYAMRLKTIGLSNVDIQRAICKLMGYNIYIP